MSAERHGVHLRGSVKTACGLDMWTKNGWGQTVTAVDSVGDHRFPDQPITCPTCLQWVGEHRATSGEHNG